MIGAELYTLAFLDIDESGAEWLADLRAHHDPLAAARIEAHFTIGFGLPDNDKAGYVEHVRALAKRTSSIAFSCCRAVVGTDHERDIGYVFLVPDEGNGAIYALHEEFYSGKRARFRRLDIPFKPHITVAQTASLPDAAAIVAEINSDNRSISGRISELAVVRKTTDGHIELVERASLIKRS